MLTARNSELDKITWLEIWADDYVAKPFSPRELLARINTILRRTIKDDENESNNILKFKNIELNSDKKTVFVDKKEISLTSNEYDLLWRILKEDWNLITREDLMTEVMWYTNYAYDRTLDTHIKNLRKKIWKKDIILTVRWVWYRLNK
jgi:DNA-binding response OmpR family regulator